jgi:hypothetical protein
LGAMKTDPQDYTSRLKAVEQYGELLFLAQGQLVDPPEQEPRQMSWEEFCVMYHARNPDPSEEQWPKLTRGSLCICMDLDVKRIAHLFADSRAFNELGGRIAVRINREMDDQPHP